MSAQEARGTGSSAYLDQFAADVLADALSAASSDYWRRRAEAWETAKPKPGDYLGRCTREDLSRAWRRCDERARACRARAEVCDAEEWRELVGDVFADVRGAA